MFLLEIECFFFNMFQAKKTTNSFYIILYDMVKDGPNVITHIGAIPFVVPNALAKVILDPVHQVNLFQPPIDIPSASFLPFISFLYLLKADPILFCMCPTDSSFSTE